MMKKSLVGVLETSSYFLSVYLPQPPFYRCGYSLLGLSVPLGFQYSCAITTSHPPRSLPTQVYYNGTSTRYWWNQDSDSVCVYVPVTKGFDVSTVEFVAKTNHVSLKLAGEEVCKHLISPEHILCMLLEKWFFSCARGCVRVCIDGVVVGWYVGWWWVRSCLLGTGGDTEDRDRGKKEDI